VLIRNPEAASVSNIDTLADVDHHRSVTPERLPRAAVYAISTRCSPAAAAELIFVAVYGIALVTLFLLMSV
jgi:hypothetical protein